MIYAQCIHPYIIKWFGSTSRCINITIIEQFMQISQLIFMLWLIGSYNIKMTLYTFCKLYTKTKMLNSNQSFEILQVFQLSIYTITL